MVGSIRALVAVCALSAFPVFSAPSDSCQASSTKMSDGKNMVFRLYVPKGISTANRYPLVMMLHGIGECGTDNLPAQAAVKVIDSLIKVHPIDTTRLYVGGLSWGGIGTEGLMMSYPDKFAAAFPCAGENKLNTVDVMTKTPYWVFHGDNDKTVPVAPDRQLISAVEAAKIDVSQFKSGANMSNPTAISVDSLRKAATVALAPRQPHSPSRAKPARASLAAPFARLSAR